MPRVRLFICALWSPAGKGLASWLSFAVSNCECHFPIGILGQVWYLIVSIPDLCTLTYFQIVCTICLLEICVSVTLRHLLRKVNRFCSLISNN